MLEKSVLLYEISVLCRVLNKGFDRKFITLIVWINSLSIYCFCCSWFAVDKKILIISWVHDFLCILVELFQFRIKYVFIIFHCIFYKMFNVVLISKITLLITEVCVSPITVLIAHSIYLNCWHRRIEQRSVMNFSIIMKMPKNNLHSPWLTLTLLALRIIKSYCKKISLLI